MERINLVESWKLKVEIADGLAWGEEWKSTGTRFEVLVLPVFSSALFRSQLLTLNSHLVVTGDRILGIICGRLEPRWIDN